MASEVTESDRKYALKVYPKMLNGEENVIGMRRARAEIESLQKCSGQPNVVQLYEVIEDVSKIVLVMEYCDGGNLMIPNLEPNTYIPSQMIDQADLADNGYFQDSKVKRILKEIGNGLKFLHDNGIIHSEITPHNILLDAAGTAKITGLDRKGDIKSRLLSILAPELAKMVHNRGKSSIPGNQ